MLLPFLLTAQADQKRPPVKTTESFTATAQPNELALAMEEAGLIETTTRRDEAELVRQSQELENVDSSEPLQPNLSEPKLEQRATQEESPVPRRIRYNVTLVLRGVYDDNINISQSDRKADFYTAIEPTITFGIGETDNNFLTLTYAPNAYLFADHSENNALQHLVTFTGQHRFPRLTLSLRQDIQLLDGTGLDTPTGTGTTFTRTNLDVAGRTRLNIYGTHLDANYSLTGKTFLTAGLDYSISDYVSLLSSSVLSGNLYLNYTYSPKLAIGAGFTGGYDTIDSPSEDQTFEQINLRASYELTGKVSASFSVGVEFRQAIEREGRNNGSPVSDGTLFYQPFDGTSVAITLSRRTLNSATLAGQDYHSTSVIISARQRFLQRLFFGLTGGYENSSYFSTGNKIDSRRTDDYYFLQASLDFNLTRFWTAGLYYFYRESNSSLDLFGFYDNQLGLRTSFAF